MNALQLIADIGGNLDDKPVTDHTDSSVTQTLAYEHFQSREPEIQKLIDAHLAVENIQKAELVSREMATEVFTMLPPMVNLDSRLTHRPSVHNKAFVLDQISGWDKHEEIRGFLSALEAELDNIKPDVATLKNVCQTFLELTTPEEERLDKRQPMVVDLTTGKSINLMAVSLDDVAYTSDEVYGYPPYVSALQPKFKALVDALNTRVLGGQVYGESSNSVICLSSICRYLKNVASSYTQIDTRITKTEQSLHAYDKDIDASMKYVIEDAVALIRNTEVDKLHFTGNACLASAVVDILKFLQ